MDQSDHNSKSPAHSFFDASSLLSHPLFGAPPTSSTSPYTHLAHMPGAFAVLGRHPAFSPTAQFGGLGSLSDTLRSHSASAVAAAFSQSLAPTTAGAGWWRSASEHARRLAGMGSEFFAGSLGASVPAAAFFQLPDRKTGESGLNGAFPALFQPFHPAPFSSPAKSSRSSKSSGSVNAIGRSSSSETNSSLNGTSSKNKKKETMQSVVVTSTPSTTTNSSSKTSFNTSNISVGNDNVSHDKQKSADASSGDSDSQLEVSSDDDDLSSGGDTLSETTEDEENQKNVELQQLQARQAELLKKQQEIKQKKLSSTNSPSKPISLTSTSTSTSTSRPISVFTSGTVPLPGFTPVMSSNVTHKTKNRSTKQEVDKERLRLQLEAELKLQQLQHKMAKKLAQQEKESKLQFELQQQPHDLSKNKPSKLSQVFVKDAITSNSGSPAIPIAPLNLSLNFSASSALEKSHQQLVAKFRTLHNETSEDEESSEESSDSESDTENLLDSSTEASDSEDLTEEGSSECDNSDEKKSNKRPGDTDQDSSSPLKKRRLITDEREARIPLEHGWRRHTIIQGIGQSGVRGEVIYYAPCGKKFKTYNEVSRYLEKNGITDIGRDNFSFSPKLNVGEFLELKNPEDPDSETSYVEITLEEVLARIAQVQARKSKRSLLDKQKLKKKLQRQELAKQSAEAKIRKKIEQQAQERKRQKERLRLLRQQEKVQRQEQLRLEKEMRAQQLIEERELKRQQAVMLKNQTELGQAPSQKTHHSLLLAMELERRKHMLVMFNLERERRRQHMMLVRALEARKKQEEKERLKEERKTEKRINKERRMEQKRLELLIAHEMKKPVDDMELRDSKPLPTLNRIPGVKLAGQAFADTLMIFEFLHNFGDSLGLDSDSLPTMNTLQLALLNDSDSEQELMSVLRHLLSFALGDPGVPSCPQAITILNQNIAQLDVDTDNISEILRLFIMARNGGEDDMSNLLVDKPFQALNPTFKASIVAFLCSELLCSKAICTQIDDNIEEMSNLRKEKWVIEGKLRKLRTIQAKKFNRSAVIKTENSTGGNDEDSSISTTNHSINLNSSIMSNRGDDDDESGNESEVSLAMGHVSEPEEEDNDTSITQEELEKKIDKLIKQQNQMRNKLFNGSHVLRAMSFGQDRYKRRYWVLPFAGGIFVEGMESAELPEELKKLEENDNRQDDINDKCKKESDSLRNCSSPTEKLQPKIVMDSPLNFDNSFLQKTESCENFKEFLDTKQDKTDSQDDRTKLRIGEELPSEKEVNGGFLDVDGFLGKSSKTTTLSSFGFTTNPVTAEQLLKNLSDIPNQKPWFSILPRMPCDETSITRLHISPNKNCVLPRYRPLPFSAFHLHNTAFANIHVNQLNGSPTNFFNNVISPHPFNHNGLPFSVPSPVFMASTPLSTSIHSSQDADSDNLYSEPQPVPIEFRYGWWCITDPNQLKALTKNFHPRGIRERNLQKNLQRHMEYACQACTQGRLEATDLEITDKDREISQSSRCAPEPDSPDLWFPDVAFRVEMALLRSVEELEERLVSSSMQVKNCKGQPRITSNENLKLIPYPCNGDPKKEKKENECYPVESAKDRLLLLEKSIERRYLKAPLGKSSSPQINISNALMNDGSSEKSADEVVPGLKLWREITSKVTIASQLALCLNMLETSIAWDKSIMKAFCQFCRNGDNEAMLLLCDGCDKGYHTYCFKPKMENIPDGDWFCYECIAKATGEEMCVVCGKKHQKMVHCEDCPRQFHLDCLEPPLTKMPRGKWRCSNCEKKPSRSKGKYKKKEKEVVEEQEENKTESGSPEKADRGIKQQLSKDLLPCRTILAELEKHEDAWPFLLPVNTKQFPTYRRVIKQPMDFSSMRTKLREMQYQSPVEFAADARLVFNNCEIFNEDNSAVGRAGHNMRKFFNKRWAEVLGEDE